MWARDQAWQAAGQGGQIPVGSPKALCPPCAPLAPATRSTHIHQQSTRWCLLPTLRGCPVLSAALLHLRAPGQHRPRPAQAAPNIHPQICFGSGWGSTPRLFTSTGCRWGPLLLASRLSPGPGPPPLASPGPWSPAFLACLSPTHLPHPTPLTPLALQPHSYTHSSSPPSTLLPTLGPRKALAGLQAPEQPLPPPSLRAAIAAERSGDRGANGAERPSPMQEGPSTSHTGTGTSTRTGTRAGTDSQTTTTTHSLTHPPLSGRDLEATCLEA